MMQNQRSSLIQTVKNQHPMKQIRCILSVIP